MSAAEKTVYEADAKVAHERYQEEKARYEADLATFNAKNPESDDQLELLSNLPMSAGDPSIKASLYNKIVRLKPGAMTEGSEYTYWCV